MRAAFWTLIGLCGVGTVSAVMSQNWQAAIWAIGCGIWVNNTRLAEDF